MVDEYGAPYVKKVTTLETQVSELRAARIRDAEKAAKETAEAIAASQAEALAASQALIQEEISKAERRRDAALQYLQTEHEREVANNGRLGSNVATALDQILIRLAATERAQVKLLKSFRPRRGRGSRYVLAQGDPEDSEDEDQDGAMDADPDQMPVAPAGAPTLVDPGESPAPGPHSATPLAPAQGSPEPVGGHG